MRSAFALAYFGMSFCIFLMKVSASDRMRGSINGTYIVHHSVCSLCDLARRDRMPVKGRSFPIPLGDF